MTDDKHQHSQNRHLQMTLNCSCVFCSNIGDKTKQVHKPKLENTELEACKQDGTNVIQCYRLGTRALNCEDTVLTHEYRH